MKINTNLVCPITRLIHTIVCLFYWNIAISTAIFTFYFYAACSLNDNLTKMQVLKSTYDVIAVLIISCVLMSLVDLIYFLSKHYVIRDLK